MELDTAQQWTKDNPIGTPVKLSAYHQPRKVASHAFWSPSMLMVLLDDGRAVQTDTITRVEPNDRGQARREREGI